MIHTIFFDLDNTLYSRKSGIWEAIGGRISIFMHEVLGIAEQDVMPLRLRFRDEYSTTLMGLKSMYTVDERQYLDFVHDVDLSSLLINDGRLRSMLSGISQRKVIFTNSDSTHAKRVLSFLEIDDFFDPIVDVVAMQPYVKPQPQAYRIALDMAGLASPDGCMFVDDMLENVEQAQREGFMAVYVGDEPVAYPTLKDIFELPNLLDQLGI